jgi:hypothetical protein
MKSKEMGKMLDRMAALVPNGELLLASGSILELFDYICLALEESREDRMRFSSALNHAVETIMHIKPCGHSGDEETGEHYDDCILCECESALAHAEHVVRLGGLGPDGRPVNDGGG